MNEGMRKIINMDSAELKVIASIEQAFRDKFGDNETDKLKAAAVLHRYALGDNKGSDPFKWVLLICIGYQCVEIEGYKKYHGINISWEEFKSWVKQYGELHSHDGSFDDLTMHDGAYKEFGIA